MRPIQRRQQIQQYGLYLLAMQTMDYGINKIPPATLLAIIGQALLFTGIIQVPWNAEDVCISAIKVLKYKDWRSFIVSNFEHGSDMHLYYNMISFILKGSTLEPLYGTANYALLLGIFSVGCSAMYVGLSWSLTQITGDWSYFTTCAIGFSAVLFALKVLTICEQKDEFHNIRNIRVASKYAVWVELLLIHMLVPNASFVGHLGGILIGCLYSYTFLGVLIDNALFSITGMPIIHKEPFYRRRRLFV
ncbi:rhomboid-related protein 4-like [Venturia canescens]|uniref:rhomboid-related protein 4-like n=1 Tax=Venturia canescens TaxID=32260 RepID=UPI001C9D10ED|nr:rhomboid-related protein 4-like [Venturia canescens]